MRKWIGIKRNPLVRGSPFSEDHVSGLLWYYVQSLSAEGLIELYEQEADEGDEPPPVDSVRRLFLGIDRFLFKMLIEPQIPQDDEVRAMFPDDEDAYHKKLALLMLQVAYAQPAGETHRLIYNGHVLLTLRDDISMEMKREHVRKSEDESDPRGLVVLPTLRHVTKRRLLPGLPEPMLFQLMQKIVEDWLREAPIDY